MRGGSLPPLIARPSVLLLTPIEDLREDTLPASRRRRPLWFKSPMR